MPVDVPPDYMTTGEVARWLRVDGTTVRRWIKSGAIDAVLLPTRGFRKKYIVSRAVLEERLNRSKKQ